MLEAIRRLDTFAARTIIVYEQAQNVAIDRYKTHSKHCPRDAHLPTTTCDPPRVFDLCHFASITRRDLASSVKLNGLSGSAALIDAYSCTLLVKAQRSLIPSVISKDFSTVSVRLDPRI